MPRPPTRRPRPHLLRGHEQALLQERPRIVHVDERRHACRQQQRTHVSGQEHPGSARAAVGTVFRSLAITAP